MKKFLMGLFAVLVLAFGISAFAQQTQQVSSFRDVHLSDWYFNDVTSLAQKGIIRGNSSGFYFPRNYANRAEVAALINRYDAYAQAQFQSKSQSQDQYVKVGDTFTMTRESNASTGYSWNAIFDGDFLQLLGKKYEAPNTAFVGAPGHDVFTFKALKSGVLSMALVYERSWEQVPAQKDFVRVTIRN